jgi:hypothetical protein
MGFSNNSPTDRVHSKMYSCVMEKRDLGRENGSGIKKRNGSKHGNSQDLLA